MKSHFHVCSSLSIAGMGCRDAIVFVVGGGCYLEHHSLQEMAKRAPPGSPKRVIYGATEMLSGSEFISQLAELGRKS